MLGFIVGLLVGGTIGVVTMALFSAAGQADRCEECSGRKNADGSAIEQ